MPTLLRRRIRYYLNEHSETPVWHHDHAFDHVLLAPRGFVVGIFLGVSILLALLALLVWG
jgi:hypothetical protein